MNPESPKIHQIAISFELTLYEETFSLIGTAKYQVTNDVDDQGISYRVGLNFFNLNNIHRSIINREVLKIERDQVRKEMENKEISEEQIKMIHYNKTGKIIFSFF